MDATNQHSTADALTAEHHPPTRSTPINSASPDASPKSLRWIVPGFVGEGLTLLTGLPKTGKTWLALDFAAAVARGGLALGSVACEQGHVVYHDGENGARRVDARFDALVARDCWRPNPDHIWLSAGAPAKRLTKYLDEWLTHRPDGRLVVFDAPDRVGPAASLMEIETRRHREAELLKLRDWAARHAVAVLVVIRAPRRGAEAERLLGIADAMLVLERESGRATLTVRSRDAAPREVALAFDEGRWTIAGDADEMRRSQQRTNIIAVLQAGGTQGPTEIAGALGEPVANIKKMLFRMLRSGEVARIGHGLYRLPLRHDDEITLSPVTSATFARKPRQLKHLKGDQ